MFPSPILKAAKAVVKLSTRKKINLTVAESCTGGLVAAALTEIPGASICFPGWFVVYSNFLKSGALGVPQTTLKKYGAVSEPVVRAMAKGALRKTGADLAVAITGIAGPSGGVKQKPVGLVHFATACRTKKGIRVETHVHQFKNKGRSSIRQDAVLAALRMLLKAAKGF